MKETGIFDLEHHRCNLILSLHFISNSKINRRNCKRVVDFLRTCVQLKTKHNKYKCEGESPACPKQNKQSQIIITVDFFGGGLHHWVRTPLPERCLPARPGRATRLWPSPSWRSVSAARSSWKHTECQRSEKKPRTNANSKSNKKMNNARNC